MRGDEIATLFTTDKPAMLAAAAARLSAAITVENDPPKKSDIILDIID
jgi:hypothetical protein